jgi:hypothetical protein
MRTTFWLDSLKGRAQSEDLGVDGRIILSSRLRFVVLDISIIIEVAVKIHCFNKKGI